MSREVNATSPGVVSDLASSIPSGSGEWAVADHQQGEIAMVGSSPVVSETEAALVFSLREGEAGRILEASAACIGLLGHDRDHLRRMTMTDLFEPVDELTTWVGQLAHQPQVVGGFTCRRGDDRRLPIEALAYRVELDQRPIGFAFLRDVSTHPRYGESEARLAAINDASDDAIIGQTADGTIVTWNQAAERLYGYAGDEILGRSLTTLMPSLSSGDFAALLERLRRGERIQRHEMLHQSKDGRTIPVTLSAAPVRDGLNRTPDWASALVVVHDISHRRQREAQLEISEQQLRLTLNAARTSTWSWDVANDVLECRGLFDTKVRSSEDLYEQMLPEDRQQAREAVRQALAEHRMLSVEYRYPREDGSIGWIQAQGQAIYDERGRPRRVIGIHIDVTDRKRAEAALRDTEQRFRSVFDTAAVGIGIVGPDGRFLYVNARLCAMFGYSEAELRRMTPHDVTYPEDMPAAREWRDRLLTNKIDSFVCELRYVHRSGRPVWGSLASSAVKDERGKLKYLVGVVEDISLRKEAEAEVRQGRETVERRARQLRDMAIELSLSEQRERRELARLLHDHLQQFLVAAKMRLSSLGQRLSDADAGQTLDEAGRLLDDAIAASRSLTVELSPPVLYEVGLGAALEWLARRMGEQYGLAVDVTHVQSPEIELLPDDMRVLIFQAVRELLFNVVKHAGVKQASVHLAREPGVTRVTVADRGGGFDPAAMAQRHDSGFGLFSVRERIEAIGGTMTVESTPRQGTRITLAAPV